MKRAGILKCIATTFALAALVATGCSDDDDGPECGNNVVDGTDQCDGDDLGGNDCTTVGNFTGGTLGCTSTCTFDTSQCTGGVPCGNGQIDQGEECDGTNLNNNDCTDVGNYIGGTLGCTNLCQYDTSQCTPPLNCGNGQIDTGENCDGANLGGNDCTTVPGGFVGGTLTCRNDCAFDFSGCDTTSDQIADARSTADGSGLDLPINNALVTYTRDLFGDDYAGFFIQNAQTGPALFIAVDPATLTPSPQAGDEVSFTITELDTYGGVRVAITISGFTRQSTGNDVTGLIQNVSNAADLVSSLDDYESELITVDATIVSGFSYGGAAHITAQIETAAITGNTDLEFRIPEVLNSTLDLSNACTLTVTGTPMWRWYTTAQVHAWRVADVTVNSCPAPQVVGATAIDSTHVVVTFNRIIEGSSVLANGSQFAFNGGLTASAATTADGTQITVTTSAQTQGANYTVTVASSVTDTNGTGIDTNANQANFLGYAPPAVVMINELNGNISNGCDLVELRVVQGGSMNGFQLWERDASLLTFSGLYVNTNDYVVVHFDTNDSTNCNPTGAVNEVNSPTDQPNSTHSQNYDTAYDWWTTDTGMTNTDNVLTLYDNLGEIMDAVFASDAPTGLAAADTETQAATVAAAGEWEMVGGGIPSGGFVDNNFNAHAAQDLNGTGTSASGESIQRNSNTDSNTVADWTQAASSWGANNTGQTNF